MTDPGTADRTYIGPMTPELVEEILEKVHMLKSTVFDFSMADYTSKSIVCVCRSGQMLFYPQWEDRHL